MPSPRRGSGRRPSAGPDLLYGRHVIEAALGARRRDLRKLLVRRGADREDLGGILEAARDARVPIEERDAQALAESVGADVGFQGVALEAGALPTFKDLRSLLSQGRGEGPRRLVALDGVEDPQNVGAIARVAEANGAAGLILTDRRAPSLGSAVARASAGAIEWLPVARVSNLRRALADAKQEGFWVVAADPTADQTLYEMPDRLLTGDLVVVLGAEGRGLRPSVLEAVDHPVRIPMAGRVESLNVSTAGAIILYDLLRRASAT